jgi:hypothetical protein
MKRKKQKKIGCWVTVTAVEGFEKQVDVNGSFKSVVADLYALASHCFVVFLIISKSIIFYDLFLYSI